MVLNGATLIADKVVIGTNGYLPESGFVDMVRELAQRGPVVLVTLRAERSTARGTNLLVKEP